MTLFASSSPSSTSSSLCFKPVMTQRSFPNDLLTKCYIHLPLSRVRNSQAAIKSALGVYLMCFCLRRSEWSWWPLSLYSFWDNPAICCHVKLLKSILVPILRVCSRQIPKLDGNQISERSLTNDQRQALDPGGWGLEPPEGMLGVRGGLFRAAQSNDH